MNDPGSPTSANLPTPSRTRCALVSVSLRLFFIVVLLAGIAGLTISAPAVAAQVTEWQSLPNQGLNGRVKALLLNGSDLYVGGWFDTLGDGTDISDHIVHYDISSGTWQSLPNQGLNGSVNALTLDGLDLYAGGKFTTLGDGTDISDNIARYDISSGTWYSLSNQGLGRPVYALALDGNDLYVGGRFQDLGDGTDIGDSIARYDISSSAWYSLTNQSIWGEVAALRLIDKDLYIGGSFQAWDEYDSTYLGGNVVRYDSCSGTWHSLADGGPGPAFFGGIFAMVGNSSDLYVGGDFFNLPDGTGISHNIAGYDIASDIWYSLPNHGLQWEVLALELDGCDLYAGGWFTTLGDGTYISDNIARYDTSTDTWHLLPNQGLNGSVHALVLDGQELYVGGGFDHLGDGMDDNDNIVYGLLPRSADQVPAPIPDASTLLMMASGLATIGGYVGLRWRVGRKRLE